MNVYTIYNAIHSNKNHFYNQKLINIRRWADKFKARQSAKYMQNKFTIHSTLWHSANIYSNSFANILFVWEMCRRTSDEPTQNLEAIKSAADAVKHPEQSPSSVRVASGAAAICDPGRKSGGQPRLANVEHYSTKLTADIWAFLFPWEFHVHWKCSRR